jgi:hypothetical protein
MIFFIVFNILNHKVLTLFYLVIVNFLLNIFSLFFVRIDLISIFAAPQGG